MQSENILLYTIQTIGSRGEVSRLLGISKQRLNSWLNDGVKMGYEHAIALELLTDGKVKAEHLVPEKVKLLKALGANIIIASNKLIPRKISLASITAPNNCSLEMDHIFELAKDIRANSLMRPIAVDEKHHLIFGRNRLEASQLLGDKMIDAYVLPLSTTLCDLKITAEYIRVFLVSERIGIGLALERIMSCGHGGRRQRGQVHISALGLGQKSRDLIAKSIGLGSHFTYQHAKQLLECGHRLLIRAVDEGIISVSAASLLSKYPKEMQLDQLSEKLKKLSMNNQRYCLAHSYFQNLLIRKGDAS